jgi:hypothetical protein
LNDDPDDRTGLCGVVGSGVDRRLYVTNYDAKDALSALEVWRVENHKDPGDCKLLGRYDIAQPEARGNYVDAIAVNAIPGQQVAYVTFGPTDEIEDAGLHVFTVTDRLAGESVDIEYTTTLVVNSPDFSPPEFGKGCRLQLRENHQRLYGGFGPGGVAMFDISNPWAPTMLAKRIFEQGSVLQIRPFEAEGRILAYVTLLSGHLIVMDVTDPERFEHGECLVFETNFQGNGTQLDPEDPSKKTLFLTDGRGGVHRVRVPAFPGE